MEPNNKAFQEKDDATGDVLISGHEYDGIRELDNRLPRWWLWLFIITIIFGGYYMMHYHVLGTGVLQEEEYRNEMAAAAEKYKKPAGEDEITAANVTLLTDEESLASGKEIYDKHCAVCHLAEGQGLVGPNLTDEYWIHGCSIGEIYELVVVGVPEKGMISWKDQLTAEQIQEVSSYIVTLVGTNPPNPKEPQGEKCEI